MFRTREEKHNTHKHTSTGRKQKSSEDKKPHCSQGESVTHTYGDFDPNETPRSYTTTSGQILFFIVIMQDVFYTSAAPASLLCNAFP